MSTIASINKFFEVVSSKLYIGDYAYGVLKNNVSIQARAAARAIAVIAKYKSETIEDFTNMTKIKGDE